MDEKRTEIGTNKQLNERGYIAYKHRLNTTNRKLLRNAMNDVRTSIKKSPDTQKGVGTSFYNLATKIIRLCCYH